MFIPDVINTLLMGLIFIVIVVTVIRPIVLTVVPALSDNGEDKQAIEAVNQHLLRHFQDAAAARTAEIRYKKMLLQLPPKAKPPEPELPAWATEPDPEELEVAPAGASSETVAADGAMSPEAAGLAETGTADGAEAGAAAAVAGDGEAGAEEALPEGEVEVREGESLAEIKERLKREQQQNKKKPAIPPELLNSANSYEDKVGVVRMVVQADHTRVASLVRSMIKIEGK